MVAFLKSTLVKFAPANDMPELVTRARFAADPDVVPLKLAPPNVLFEILAPVRFAALKEALVAELPKKVALAILASLKSALV